MDNQDKGRAIDSTPQSPNGLLYRIDSNDTFHKEGETNRGVQHISHQQQQQQDWFNWTCDQSCRPSRIFHPHTLKDVVDIIHLASTLNKKIRCVGGGYSLSSCSLVEDDGFLVIVRRMNTIFAPTLSEDGMWTVEVETGVSIKDLDSYLRKRDPPLTLSANAVFESVRDSLIFFSLVKPGDTDPPPKLNGPLFRQRHFTGACSPWDV